MTAVAVSSRAVSSRADLADQAKPNRNQTDRLLRKNNWNYRICLRSKRHGIDQSEAGKPASASAVRSEQTLGSFVRGPSNQLAHTAMTMVCQDPRAASPLFVCGPTGTGKSHILAAIADQFRRRHRMRRVMLLSAEQFTNDFISSVGSSGIAAFRRRYREVDALLIDGMQFLVHKQRRLREMLYTVETIVSSGRPLIALGIRRRQPKSQGLTSELAGRLVGRIWFARFSRSIWRHATTLLRREIGAALSLWPMPESTIQQINATLSGDGRVIQGVANLTNTLQRMLGRIPTIDELRRFGGDLLRTSQPSPRCRSSNRGLPSISIA